MSGENPIPESEIRTDLKSRPAELERPLAELSRAEKEALWKKTATVVDQVIDAEKEPIDRGIKETVIALNVHNINTSGSCEGHINHGTGTPWVQIEAPGEPEERYIGQNDAIQKIAEKHSLNFDDVKRGIDEKAHEEASDIYSNNGETSDFTKWREQNRIMKQRVAELLGEFYQDREVSPDVHLMLDDYDDDSFRLNTGSDKKPINEQPDDNQRRELTQRLQRDQVEMTAFTEFLKKKYFGE
ncbi:MAG: hypothetical protein PHH01_01040 [Patescibacteria group bacterium]|nr:hypothetical protein [Patescibacteria group bacterium]